MAKTQSHAIQIKHSVSLIQCSLTDKTTETVTTEEVSSIIDRRSFVICMLVLDFGVTVVILSKGVLGLSNSCFGDFPHSFKT